MPSESFHERYYGSYRNQERRERISGQHYPDFGSVFPDMAARLIAEAGLSGHPDEFDFYVRPATHQDYVNGVRKSHVVEIHEKSNNETAPIQGDNSWANPSDEKRGGVNYDND